MALRKLDDATDMMFAAATHLLGVRVTTQRPVRVRLRYILAERGDVRHWPEQDELDTELREQMERSQCEVLSRRATLGWRVMIGLVLMVRKVLGAFRTAWADQAFRGLAIALAALVASATLFYTLVEGWAPLDSAYFAVVTGLTIGYGDLAPQTSLGKVFTMLYALLAVGLFVALGATLAKAYLTNRANTKARIRRRRPQDD